MKIKKEKKKNYIVKKKYNIFCSFEAFISIVAE